mmetsp:Transcript_15110/g.45277  ORF Transcript_15110/g.45277 Transcript_15110/m.45277 type:complete len:313 (+) Transcript_15110:204-1142(+)
MCGVPWMGRRATSRAVRNLGGRCPHLGLHSEARGQPHPPPCALKGMRREFGDTPPQQRWGVRTQQLRQAMVKCLPRGSSRSNQAWRAALTCAFCGLLRGGEVALPEGVAFNALKHLTRADVQFHTLDDGRRVAVLWLHQAKNPRMLTGKTTPVFLVSGGTIIDPVAELELMFQLDPVAAEEAASLPLFRTASGAAFTRRGVGRMVKVLMAAIGLDPARFGAHSLRIGGATAALAAGVPLSVIRITGRWASDIWITYARLSKQAALRVSAVVGSTSFEDAEQGAFNGEELGMASMETALGGARSRALHRRWRR